MTLPNFASSYETPGVYWALTNTPQTANGNFIGPRLAIVGPAIGYFSYTGDNNVQLTGTTPQVLSKQGIVTASIVVQSLDAVPVVYTAGTDYTVTTTGSGSASITSIARNGSGSIGSGAHVAVLYNYADASYYTPRLVNNMQDVSALYGASYNTDTGAIVSPLSLAAEIAFKSGSVDLVLVPVPLTSGVATAANLLSGLNQLAARNDVSLVAVLPVGVTGTNSAHGDVVTVATNLEAYLAAREAEGLFQVGIIGYEPSVANTDATTIGADYIAQQVAYRRVVETWPNQVNYAASGQYNLALAGYYVAAAIGGLLGGNAPQDGITRYALPVFPSFPTAVLPMLTEAKKTTLSAAGVCVIESNRNGTIQVRHGVTTDPSSIYNFEISLVRIQDAMIESLQSAIANASIIGSPITGDSVSALQGLVETILNGLITSGDISAFQGVTVTQNVTTPTEIDVVFSYLPIYPLNYITISFSIDASSSF